MRKLPQGLPDNIDKLKAQLEAQSQKSRITQVREYRIITALFGGGVEPNHADPITVVRATEVRGHLRFWWRATRGGQYSSLEKLKAAEDAIWGAAATSNDKVGQSAVWVEVEVLERGEPLTVRWTKRRELQPPSCDVGDPSSPLSYVAFPLREEKDETGTSKSPQPVLSMVRFAVTFSYVEQVEVPSLPTPLVVATELDAALWAWETFGGIGARTRRGFGALRCESINGKPNTNLPPATRERVLAWLDEKLREYGVVQQNLKEDNVPLLPMAFNNDNCWVGTIANNNHHAKPIAEQDAVNTWVGLFTKMKEFRQQRPRNGNRPGRNRWPEPDAIRRLTKQRAPQHGSDVSNVDKFPRAAFGLPIQFEFKDKKDGDPKGKNPLLPKQQEEVLDRFASPLILKPIACRREGDNDRAIGLALILQGTEVPDDLYLKGVNQPITRKLTQAEASQIPVLKGETDVLKAFLRFLQR